MHMLGREQAEKDAAAALALGQAMPLGDGELSPEDMNAIQLGEGETLEQLKAKLKPKKSNISMEMLDTANSYDDKVALVRMIVAEDSARVASVLKNMIKAG
jgi:flagellar M-ring protein FliF